MGFYKNHTKPHLENYPLVNIAQTEDLRLNISVVF